MTKKKAFTIIELMLAMAFLGTMLVGIASLTMRITNIYQKGLALRSINSIGREIISDLTRVTNASRVNIDINPEVPESGKVEQKDIDAARADYFLSTSDSEGRQLGGVFCTGDYSYVWNTADNLRIARANEELKAKKYNDSNIKTALDNRIYVISVGSPTQYIIPKFARFIDKDRRACAHTEAATSSGVAYEPAVDDKAGSIKKAPFLFSLSDTLTTDAVTELIEDNESDLAMYNFTIFPATQHATTKQIFYSGMFILATYRGGVNIKSNGDFCEGSDNEDGSRDLDSNGNSEMTMNDFDYCAVNKFNFSARATGETGINKHGE
jgi:type II secretory pathway pseudopilin PulG